MERIRPYKFIEGYEEMTLIFKYELSFEANDATSMVDANELMSQLTKDLDQIKFSCTSIQVKK